MNSMEKRLLILSEYYLDDKSPISNCINSLLDGFDLNDLCYDLICFGNDNYSIERGKNIIHVVKYRNYVKNYFHRLINWPINNNVDINKMYEVSSDIIKKKQINCIFAVHCNYVSIKVALMLKTNITKVLYLLDPISSKHDKYYLGYKRILFPLIIFKEFNAFLKFNYILCMKSMLNKYNNSYFKLFKNKINYVDFPLIQDLSVKLVTDNKIKISEYKFILFGSLSKKIRSPLYFIELFKKLFKVRHYCVDLYIEGDCFDLFNIQNTELIFNNCKYIDKNSLLQKFCNYDYFINVGNSIIDMLPSKIFQMFMTGKPIIHFAKSKEDCCNEYMESYGNALIIYEEDDLDYSLNRLLEFLKDYKIVPIEKVKEIFKENTPEYQANLIKELVLDN